MGKTKGDVAANILTRPIESMAALAKSKRCLRSSPEGASAGSGGGTVQWEECQHGAERKGAQQCPARDGTEGKSWCGQHGAEPKVVHNSV
jgi:hypothetical protein